MKPAVWQFGHNQAPGQVQYKGFQHFLVILATPQRRKKNNDVLLS